MSTRIAFLVFALLAVCANSARPADAITSLPGWSGPLPSRMWSGFIDCGGDVQDGIARNMSYWYMFVEAETSNPQTAPLVLWTNGGPGAASSYGLFTELGPFTLSDQSMQTSPPTLFANPYSWSKLANVLILNGPAPVGYSYCTPAGPGGDGKSCGSWNDTRTLIFNRRFLDGWVAEFPEYTGDLYITGESYAGVYTAMLVDSLLSPPKSTLPLRGLALGDACMGTEVLCGPSTAGPWLSLLFSAGQGCISLQTFNTILTQCPLTLLQDGPISAGTPECQAAIAQAAVDCPRGSFYDYNYLDQCPPDPFSSHRATTVAVDPPVEPSGYPCGGDAALKAWITLPATKQALHVDAAAQYHSFDNGEGFVYNTTWTSNLALMRRLQTGADGVRTLVYNGETDPSVSSIRSQNWTFSMGFPLKEGWRPWTFPGNSSIVAGQVVQWQGDFTHATIRGSGHMVPGYKPYSAYLMLQTWLANAPWPSLPPATANNPARILPSSDIVV